MLMPIDPYTLTLLGLLGTWSLVIGTLILMFWQMRQNQHLHSANSVMTLRERFDSDRMRAARRHLSQKLIAGAHEDIASVEVLTFLELIGALTHRKLLDEELVWEAFGTWVTIYFLAIRRPVDMLYQLRTSLKDPLVFHELEWLFHRIESIDSRMLGAQALSQVEQEKETLGMLKREAVLLENWAPDHTPPPKLI